MILLFEWNKQLEPFGPPHRTNACEGWWVFHLVGKQKVATELSSCYPFSCVSLLQYVTVYSGLACRYTQCGCAHTFAHVLHWSLYACAIKIHLILSNRIKSNRTKLENFWEHDWAIGWSQHTLYTYWNQSLCDTKVIVSAKACFAPKLLPGTDFSDRLLQFYFFKTSVVKNKLNFTPRFSRVREVRGPPWPDQSWTEEEKARILHSVWRFGWSSDNWVQA